jgi:5-formyltetrahydrofolate cyclo-ligase
MSSPESTAQAKSRLRRAVRAARRERLRNHMASGTEGLTRTAGQVAGLVPGAACIGAYLAAPGEPDPIGAMSTWHSSGISVLVPRSLPGRRLEWVRWTPDLSVRTGDVAPVPEPVGGIPGDPQRMDLVVVPALGMGRDGTRLGQGGGFYDTFLSEHPDVPTVGCIFDDELVDSVPAEEWDAVLGASWTPSGIQRSHL